MHPHYFCTIQSVRQSAMRYEMKDPSCAVVEARLAENGDCTKYSTRTELSVRQAIYYMFFTVHAMYQFALASCC